MAAFTVALILYSCTGDSPTRDDLYAGQGGTFAEYNLNGLTISTIAFAPDYATAGVVVSVNSLPCATRILSESGETFTLSSGGFSCGHFKLNLQYVPASAPCQPGGIFLSSGSVTAPDGGPTLEYTNLTLAAWDGEGNLIDPWITPFDAPALISQAFQQNWTVGDPLNRLGSWTYTIDYRSAIVPPADCSLKTAVELTLTSADERIEPRVYHYVVTEKNTGGPITAGISADEPAAPAAVIVLDESALPNVARRISVAGLDALRDAKAHARVAFVQSDPVIPVSAAFADPLRPFVDLDSEIDIASGGAATPLASHLAGFFSDLTASVKAASGSLQPTLPVTVTVSLATPQPDGFPPVVIPLIFVPQRAFRPGIDDKNDCTTTTPDMSFSCSLASAVAKARSAVGTSDPAASYILDVTFSGGNAADLRPVLRVRRAVLPVSKISEEKK
jgi:hypothetical protein